jgi:hypothetical protein
MVNSLAQKDFIVYDKEAQKFKVDHSREGFVYIIRAVGTNRIKIGFSKDPEKRLASLTSPQMPFDLELVYKEWFIDAYALEQCMHKTFHRYRVKGEWFEIPIDIEDCVDDHDGIEYKFCSVYQDEYENEFWGNKIYHPYPIESVLIRIGLNEFFDDVVRPVVTEFVKCFATACNIDDKRAWNGFDANLSSLLQDKLEYISVCSTEPDFLSKATKWMFDELNTVVFYSIEAKYTDQDMGYGKESWKGMGGLTYQMGVIAGVIETCRNAIQILRELGGEIKPQPTVN